MGRVGLRRRRKRTGCAGSRFCLLERALVELLLHVVAVRRQRFARSRRLMRAWRSFSGRRRPVGYLDGDVVEPCPHLDAVFRVVANTDTSEWPYCSNSARAVGWARTASAIPSTRAACAGPMGVRPLARCSSAHATVAAFVLTEPDAVTCSAGRRSCQRRHRVPLCAPRCRRRTTACPAPGGCASS